MKQDSLFGEEYEKKEQSQYTSVITLPIYEIRGDKPHILELTDGSKSRRLISRIKSAPNISEEERQFLIVAAKRHTVFNYERIADYYANASKDMQNLMEESALVVIDFDKAYEHGYVELAHDAANQYFENYNE